MAKRYPEEQIETALILAAGIGIRPAARQTGIPVATIHAWTRDRVEQYTELREQEAGKWRLRAAVQAEDLADRSHALAVKALEQAERDLKAGELKPQDYLSLLKTTVLNMGISIDKANVLRDRPTEVVEHRYDLRQIERAIRATEQVIEGKAVEIPAELEPAEG